MDRILGEIDRFAEEHADGIAKVDAWFEKPVAWIISFLFAIVCAIASFFETLLIIQIYFH